MTNLSPEICRKVKEARREAGLSQSVLAAEVGCKQSALSMFEQGDGTKLNEEVIEKLCKSRRQMATSPITAGGAVGMYTHMPIEVTVGGATVFVLNVEQFAKF